MDQTLALEIMEAGHSVLLTGPAGSGKTFVLNEFIRRSKHAGKHISVTATTGLAATHLSGSTIHAWSGIGIHDELPNKFHEHLPKGRRDIIEKTDILVIDEVSMLHDYRLDMVDQIAREVRGDNAPFGGLQVVLCGDFFQLPPVNRRGGRGGGFVVNAAVWDELDLKVCYLNEQHRQHDDTFLEILNAIRTNDLRRRHLDGLLAKIENRTDQEQVTELHTTNVDVDSINEARLAEVDGEEHVYYMQTTGKANYVESLKRSCLALETLKLKEGALVMCIKNNAEKRYANGSLGVVVGFEELTEYPVVELRNGREVTITPDTWELRDGDKKRASLTQLPLRLAWAITVHKSQGMTLDAARVDLKRAFVEGMGYVALSRVRQLDSLELLGLNAMALKVSPQALEIDEVLRSKSAKHAQELEYLRENAKNKKPPKKQKSSSWNEKVAHMRETYPNAYRPWTDDDDKKLKGLFDAGTNLTKITEALGRQPNAVKIRLKKHYGEDVTMPPKS